MLFLMVAQAGGARAQTVAAVVPTSSPAVKTATTTAVAAMTPGQPFSDTVPGALVKWDMVALPAPPGNVSRAKSLWMSKTEVTWDLYDIYAFRLDLTEDQKAQNMDATSRPSKPYGAPDRGFGHQGYPALAMTYASAQGFCDWLSKKTGRKYRLPTEAEWEWAATAGGKEKAPADPKAVAWYWDTTEDKTQAVATKAPNALGLHDTLGNVWEWCAGQDGTPVVRGGGFLDKADKMTPAARATQTPAWNATDPQNPKSKWWLANAPFVGFRIVCEP